MTKTTRLAGQVLNREELAGLLGVSTTTIDNFIRAGCPVVEKGAGRRPYKFNSADVLAWRGQREADARAASGEGDAEQAKRRHTLAAAELKELQLAEKRGELVSITAVTAKWLDECVAVRSRLLAIPARLSGRLSGETDPGKIDAAIDEEIRGALSELSG